MSEVKLWGPVTWWRNVSEKCIDVILYALFCIINMWSRQNTTQEKKYCLRLSSSFLLSSMADYRKASSRGAYGHDPWRSSTWFHNNRYYNGTIYIIDNVIVLSDLVESSGYSSKTLQKGSWPYAPLDEVSRYETIIKNMVIGYHLFHIDYFIWYYIFRIFDLVYLFSLYKTCHIFKMYIPHNNNLSPL